MKRIIGAEIMFGDMDAMCRVGRARPARNEAYSRSPCQSPYGQGRHRRPGLLTADYHLNCGVVQSVECGQIGFARYTVDVVDALNDELVDENLAARSRRCDGHGEPSPGYNRAQSGSGLTSSGPRSD